MTVYHGLNKDSIIIILEHGLNSFSYWGTIEEALKYTDCNKVIALELDRAELIIHPNDTLINHYKENDSELYQKWMQSELTWKDSLEIFGSIIIEDQVFIDEDSIRVIN
jgi:hypothetical protein